MVVSAFPQPRDMLIVAGVYDLDTLLVDIEYAIKCVLAMRTTLNSFGSVFKRFSDCMLIRSGRFLWPPT